MAVLCALAATERSRLSDRTKKSSPKGQAAVSNLNWQPPPVWDCFFVIHCRQDWAPYASVRFLELVCAGYYNDQRFMLVVPETFAQLGTRGDPKQHALPLLKRKQSRMTE